MQFRMFTRCGTDEKVAINVDMVRVVSEWYLNGEKRVAICVGSDMIYVEEDFNTVISRLNIVAE
jgi:hypothetical protein